MALSKSSTVSSLLHGRPLAEWKTWWGGDLAKSIAKALNEHINPIKLPGHGQILETNHFTGDSLKDDHVAAVAEALLTSYPEERQPSAYLMGDAVLALDNLWKGGLLGGPKDSPIQERARRNSALATGGKMKRLLSYVRTSALKSELGKTPAVTYLKTLANRRLVNIRRSSSVSTTASSSPCTSENSV